MAAALKAESQLATSASSGGPPRIATTPTSEQSSSKNDTNAISSTPVATSSSSSQPPRTSLAQATSPPLNGPEHGVQQHARLDVNVSTSSLHTTRQGSLRRGTLSPASSQRSLVTPSKYIG